MLQLLPVLQLNDFNNDFQYKDLLLLHKLLSANMTQCPYLLQTVFSHQNLTSVCHWHYKLPAVLID